jgi:hypothetical protein
MIEKMTPQPFPLWAVEGPSHDEVLVLGWVATKTAGLLPVVVQLAERNARPYLTAAGCQFFADRDAAQDAALSNLSRP